MKNFKFQISNFKFLIVFALCYMLFAAFSTVNAAALTAEEVVKKSQEAFFYQGKDFKARVIMKLISKGGQERVRELTMLRKNYGASGGEQKYFMYFYQPADVKDMTFMVYKYPCKRRRQVAFCAGNQHGKKDRGAG